MSRTSKGAIEKRRKPAQIVAGFATKLDAPAHVTLSAEQAAALHAQSKRLSAEGSSKAERAARTMLRDLAKSAPAEDRAALLARAKRAADAITDEEDAAITAAALTDPDALPNRTLRRVGRPTSADPKLPVNLRLDREVVEYFKAEGDGWQTRLNAALRKAAGLD